MKSDQQRRAQRPFSGSGWAAVYAKARGASRLTLALSACLWLGACSVLDKPTRALVYDFGPGAQSTAPASLTGLPALALAEVEAASAFDSSAILYRLAYANAQQLLPYAQARWSMPPAQLLRQRLRESIGQHRIVLSANDGLVAGASAPNVLHLELEEFSQLFDAPDSSVGLVRVRATLVRPTAGGDSLLAQRSFFAQRGAPSADAAGGVRALTAASDAVVEELALWLTQIR